MRWELRGIFCWGDGNYDVQLEVYGCLRCRKFRALRRQIIPDKILMRHAELRDQLHVRAPFELPLAIYFEHEENIAPVPVVHESICAPNPGKRDIVAQLILEKQQLVDIVPARSLWHPVKSQTILCKLARVLQ